MILDEYASYRQELLDQAKDDNGFIDESLLLSQVMPLMLDSKLVDSEDYNHSYIFSSADKFKVNAYGVNESGERLQLFLVDESTIDLSVDFENLEVSTRAIYDAQFRRVIAFINKAVKGHLNEEIQDSSPARPLIQKMYSAEGVHQFDVIEIFLISATATVETRGATRQPKRIEFEDETIGISYKRSSERIQKEVLIIKRLVDLNFLYNVETAQGNRLPLIIDFQKKYGYRIEVIKAAEEEYFESYLCVLPASLLAKLYKDNSSRMFERNVRSFLEVRGANRGIRDTIKLNPERFIAFNNGITVTCTGKEIEEHKGRSFITSLTDFQIVNGGQTTASIFFAQKDGLSIEHVKVMAKINVAKGLSEEGLDSLISEISKFSNSQTRVSVVDLSSRNPQLNKIKALSESVITPSGRKWYFEKARGEFNTKRRIAGSNRARIDREYPKEFRFSKEQLGKYYIAWGGRPYVVKKGGEKVFRYFIQEIGGDEKVKSKKEINRQFYEEMVARIILFRKLEKLYGQGKGSIGQLRSAVVPYSLSILYNHMDGSDSGNEFDLQRVWLKEDLEDDTSAFFFDLMKLMNQLINKYSESDDKGEDAKNEDLWEKIENCKEVLKFMSSPNSLKIQSKYAVSAKDRIARSENDEGVNEVDFKPVSDAVEIFSKGVKFYESLRDHKSLKLTESEVRNLDRIIASIVKLNDLDKQLIEFETKLLSSIRRSKPEVFDSIISGLDLLLESTLKFIVQNYNQSVAKGNDVGEHFKSLRDKAAVRKAQFASVFDKIGVRLAEGIAPTIKDIDLASSYFKTEEVADDTTVTKKKARSMNLSLLRKMVQWDSKMRILTKNELSYLAGLAYELQPLNAFHKEIAEKHLNTLVSSGFDPYK